MAGIHVRDLTDDLVDALKRRAEVHHRSLQGEIRAILSEAARAAPPKEGFQPLQLIHVKVGGTTSWSRNELYDDSER